MIVGLRDGLKPAGAGKLELPLELLQELAWNRSWLVLEAHNEARGTVEPHRPTSFHGAN